MPKCIHAMRQREAIALAERVELVRRLELEAQAAKKARASALVMPKFTVPELLAMQRFAGWAPW